MFHAELPPAEVETRLPYVHDREHGAPHLYELADAQTDGTCADDEDEIIRLDVRALDGMGTDPERLDERELIVGECARAVELARRDDDLRPHAAVDVHSERFQLGAAIGSSRAARDAPPAIQVGLDRAAVAGFQPVRLAAGIDDLDAELMAENPRVVKKWLPSGKGVEIGAAHADAVHPHEGLTRRRLGAWSVDSDKSSRSFERDLNHDHAHHTRSLHFATATGSTGCKQGKLGAAKHVH